MLIDIKTACNLLLEHDNIVILAHRKPDGDTLGSSFALLYALQSLGKTARVECADALPAKFGFIYGDYKPADFAAEYIVSADIAGKQLLGSLEGKYGDKVDLCIDHHKSNEMFATHTLLDADAPAAAQLMLAVIKGLGVEITAKIADAIFTGLTTDTGCFRFASVTAKTHIAAAEVMAAGADHATINRLMFETKSRGRLEVEKLVLETLSYYFEGQCALIYLPLNVSERFGVSEEELDGISALPRTIEGVLAGITVRERTDSSYRISLRTRNPLDASEICASLGGGGHCNAAGCTLSGTLEEAKAKILEATRLSLERIKA